MGISIGFSRSSYDSSPTIIEKIKTIFKKLPNPDPNNYVIIKAEQINNYVIANINYQDATNYEGNKILVFEDYTLEKLYKRKSIDPHFSESKKFKSPIARFEPTKKGWNLAVKLCK